MKFYKFKSLEQIEYPFEIIDKEQLYCADYGKLNDPFEGQFFVIIRQGGFSPDYSTAFDRIEKQLNKILEPLKICSLSKDLNDVRMWSFYANDHKGIVIEIDFTGFENDVAEVHYLEALPEYNPKTHNPAEILTKKTMHWSYESEYRVIQENDYYSVKGRISAVYLGQRISHVHMDILKKITPSTIPIYTTKLEPHNIKIVPGDLVKR